MTGLPGRDWTFAALVHIGERVVHDGVTGTVEDAVTDHGTGERVLIIATDGGNVMQARVPMLSQVCTLHI